MTTPTLKSRLLEEFEKLLSGRLSLLLGDSLAIARSKRAFLAGAKAGLEESADLICPHKLGKVIKRGHMFCCEHAQAIRTLSKSLGEEV